MGQLEFFVNVFITLFALIDPIGLVPIFASATQTLTVVSRRWLVFYIALFTAVGLLVFYFSGLALLKFFGISLDAFKIAGGFLLFLMGLEMTRGEFSDMFEDKENTVTSAQEQGGSDVAMARQRFEKLVVPFAFPLMIGPGAISTVIILAGNAGDINGGNFAAVGAIIAVSFAILVTFLLANTISRLLGRIGMVIVIRVMGLILCALSVQIIITSVSEITRGVIKPSAAHPYEMAKHK